MKVQKKGFRVGYILRFFFFCPFFLICYRVVFFFSGLGGEYLPPEMYYTALLCFIKKNALLTTVF